MDDREKGKLSKDCARRSLDLPSSVPCPSNKLTRLRGTGVLVFNHPGTRQHRFQSHAGGDVNLLRIELLIDLDQINPLVLGQLDRMPLRHCSQLFQFDELFGIACCGQHALRERLQLTGRCGRR
jgi:hypothetical protein